MDEGSLFICIKPSGISQVKLRVPVKEASSFAVLASMVNSDNLVVSDRILGRGVELVSLQVTPFAYYPSDRKLEVFNLIKIYPNLFGKKYIIANSKSITKVKNIKNIIKFIPDTKIKLNHIRKIKRLWPISGCVTNNNIIGIIIKKLSKYL